LICLTQLGILKLCDGIDPRRSGFSQILEIQEAYE